MLDITMEGRRKEGRTAWCRKGSKVGGGEQLFEEIEVVLINGCLPNNDDDDDDGGINRAEL